jgi:cytosine/adenosine deaminase-related metal-dependent hydrolase
MYSEVKCEVITPDCEVIRGILDLDELIFEERDVEADYVVLPTFFNAHTHLADSIAKDIPRMPLEMAVRDYKFRILKSAKDEEIIRGIKNCLELARKSGTSAILEFREGGLKGYELLKVADEFGMCLPLTRPSNLSEAEILAEVSFGFGMSSTRDHDLRFLEELRELARLKNKVFAIHAGEKDSEDVESALALEPDLLIHMNMAERRQLKVAVDEGIPIVSCIRSNAFFGLLNKDNYQLLAEYDRWLLGTDNAMVCSPSLLEEMHFASYLLGKDYEILRAVFRGFDLFGVEPKILVLNKRYNLFKSKNLILSVVRRANVEDIEFVLDKSFYEVFSEY